MLEKILEEIDGEINECGYVPDSYYCLGLEKAKDIIRKHMNDEAQQERYFTDDEYRILLSALRREDEVCRKVDQDCGDDHKLIRIMTSIKRKIRRIQYEKTWKPYNMNDGWILCEERLPEEPKKGGDIKQYNVTIEGAEESTSLFYIGHGTWRDEDCNWYKVIAWQPLPAPYRPEKGVEI